MSAVERYSGIIATLSQFYHQISNADIPQHLKDSILLQSCLTVEYGGNAEKTTLISETLIPLLQKHMDAAQAQVKALNTAAYLIPLGGALLLAGHYFRSEEESSTRKYLCIALQVVGVAFIAISSITVATYVVSTRNLYNETKTQMALLGPLLQNINLIKDAFPIALQEMPKS